MSEQLHRFGADAHLCGVLNQPDAGHSGDAKPAVVFLTAGLLPKPGPFRLYVELARTLEHAGFAALRFDLSGIGESGTTKRDADAAQSAVADVREAMDMLAAETGAQRFILAGLCSGAELAHRAAVSDERVCGMIAMDGYILRTPAYYLWHYLPRVFSARKWFGFTRAKLARLRRRPAADGDAGEESLAFWGGPAPAREHLVAEFALLCRRNVRQLQVFSGGSGDCSYEGQFRDAFRGVDFNGLLDVKFLPETDHVYVLQADRQRLMNVIIRWTQENFAREPSAERRPRSEPASPWTGTQAVLANLSGNPASPAKYAERRNLE